MTDQLPASSLNRECESQRLGVLDFHPIQYRAPLYQRLASRGNVDFDVLFLSDHGYRAAIDPGSACQWPGTSICCPAIPRLPGPREQPGRARHLVRWIVSHDAVIVHGYVHPWMLFAMASVPLPADPVPAAGRIAPARPGPLACAVTARRRCPHSRLRQRWRSRYRRTERGVLPPLWRPEDHLRAVLRGRRAVRVPAAVNRADDLLARWGLDESRPVIMFCGKLIPRKRPLDLPAAISLLPDKVTTLFVGDGAIVEQVRAILPGEGAVTGFVNQSELPSYYHAADIFVLPSEAEPWGLVVNEAMAAGALPVVSDRVGAAPDLVRGIGEVYPCGDVTALAGALSRALARVGEPGIRDQVRRHVARYSLDTTAAGFEEAVLTLPAATERSLGLARPERPPNSQQPRDRLRCVALRGKALVCPLGGPLPHVRQTLRILQQLGEECGQRLGRLICRSGPGDLVHEGAHVSRRTRVLSLAFRRPALPA